MRRLRAVLIGLLLVLGSVVAIAAPAHAAVPNVWAFAYMDNDTPPVGWVMDTTRQAGTFSTVCPGRWGTVSSPAVGVYEVRFPCSASPGGIVHVTGIDPTGRYCTVGSWRSVAGDLLITVFCFSPTGLPDRSRFSVVYTTSSGTDGASGGHGYVFADGFGSLIASYNTTGAVNTVGRIGLGLYTVRLPRLSWWQLNGDLQATAVYPGVARRCKVENWSFVGADYTVIVSCVDRFNARADSAFTLSLHNFRAVYGSGWPPLRFAYRWHGGTDPLTTFTSAGGTSRVVPLAVGEFGVEFTRVGAVASHMQVTAYGPGSAYCQFNRRWFLDAERAIADAVVCFDGLGHMVDSSFLITYASSA